MNIKDTITIRIRCTSITQSESGKVMFGFKIIGINSICDDVHLYEEELMEIEYNKNVLNN